AFELGTRLIQHSGIESISGGGISGIALEKGFYQTKLVVGRDTNSAPVGIWTVCGRAPRPRHELDWLPADRVWAGLADVDLGAPPLPVTLRLTIVRQGDYLFVASNDELIKTMMAVKAGKLAGLKPTAEFKHLAQGMLSEGNAFSFISQRLSDTVQQIQKTALS